MIDATDVGPCEEYHLARHPKISAAVLDPDTLVCRKLVSLYRMTDQNVQQVGSIWPIIFLALHVAFCSPTLTGSHTSSRAKSIPISLSDLAPLAGRELEILDLFLGFWILADPSHHPEV